MRGSCLLVLLLAAAALLQGADPTVRLELPPSTTLTEGGGCWRDSVERAMPADIPYATAGIRLVLELP
jgi:hypothetical protein